MPDCKSSSPAEERVIMMCGHTACPECHSKAIASHSRGCQRCFPPLVAKMVVVMKKLTQMYQAKFIPVERLKMSRQYYAVRITPRVVHLAALRAVNATHLNCSDGSIDNAVHGGGKENDDDKDRGALLSDGVFVSTVESLMSSELTGDSGGTSTGNEFWKNLHSGPLGCESVVGDGGSEDEAAEESEIEEPVSEGGDLLIPDIAVLKLEIEQLATFPLPSSSSPVTILQTRQDKVAFAVLATDSPITKSQSKKFKAARNQKLADAHKIGGARKRKGRWY